jgi:DNA repair protein RecN (Recombination protein N)
MSRFLLALKACFSKIEQAGTLVFDEIDVGVSGRVAGAIAEKLHLLGRQHQVLCVTHQPLVAAMADRHFRVDKEVIGSNSQKGRKSSSKVEKLNGVSPLTISEDSEVRTVVRVKVLEERQRLEELAQLASGKSAKEALAFAESLLVEAATRRDVVAKIQAKNRRGSNGETAKKGKPKA